MEHLFSFRGGYCWKPKIASEIGVPSSFLGTKMPRNAFLSHLYDTWKSGFENETLTELRLWLNCPSHVHITGADRKWNSCDLKKMIYSRSEINSSLFIIVKTHFRDWILITAAQCEYFNREPVFKPSLTFFQQYFIPAVMYDSYRQLQWIYPPVHWQKGGRICAPCSSTLVVPRKKYVLFWYEIACKEEALISICVLLPPSVFHASTPALGDFSCRIISSKFLSANGISFTY